MLPKNSTACLRNPLAAQELSFLHKTQSSWAKPKINLLPRKSRLAQEPEGATLSHDSCMAATTILAKFRIRSNTPASQFVVAVDAPSAILSYDELEWHHSTVEFKLNLDSCVPKVCLLFDTQ